jgi:cytochrome P450
MARYAQVTVDLTERMLDTWPNGEEIDVAEEMGRLMLLVMAQALLGTDLSNQFEEVRTMVYELSSAMMRDIQAPIRMSWLPTENNRRKRKAIEDFDKLLWQIVRQRKESNDDYEDLLSILLSASEDPASDISEKQVRDEVATVFNAGHDTAAAGMTWAWLAIAQHPEIEARLCEEIDQVIGERSPTWEDAKKLTYTEMVVKETMRLYPPGWTLFAREPLHDVQIGDYVIPRKSWVFTFPYVTHRDERFFESPLRFDPERFAPERASSIPPCAYFPFGAGPHICIGNQFSMLEMKLAIALVLRRFHLDFVADQGEIEEEALLNLWPKGGLKMIATSRSLSGSIRRFT